MPPQGPAQGPEPGPVQGPPGRRQGQPPQGQRQNPPPPRQWQDRGPAPWRTAPGPRPPQDRAGEQSTYQQQPYETYDSDGQLPDNGAPTRGMPFTAPPAAEATEERVPPASGGPQLPRKITVTRVAFWRGRQLSQGAVAAFRRAAHADGAHESGLAALTYAVMINYASSATMAVGLANTLFFSAATAESKTKVATYLLITVAPFALIAPVIGPLLDRVQRGRRIALALSCVGQGLLSVVMALHFNDWLLYPAALGTMVLSKSFDVLRAAIAPRVLPQKMTLSKTNARLTVFGLAAGAVFGAIGSGGAKMFGSPGALWFTAVLCIADAVLCLRIPAWVEVTEGEVPTSLRVEPRKARRQPLGRHVVLGLWGNGTIRVLTGFLMLFPAFVIKSLTEHSPGKQLLLLGLVGGAAGLGSFVGNGIGARMQFGRPAQVVIACLSVALAGSVLGAILPGIGTVAVAALVAATASGLAKISLDATIQNDLPEASRASAFGRSETVLQLAWVLGGALGVLLPNSFWIGFTVVSVLLAVGLVQTVLTRRGQTLVPRLGGDRPLRPAAFRPRGSAPVDPGPAEPAPAGVRTHQVTKAMPTDHLNGSA
jgi:MFS family permease